MKILEFDIGPRWYNIVIT